MSSPAVYVSKNEDDSQGISVPRGDEVFTQRGDKFGPHFRSQSTSASLGALRRLCNIPQEIEFSLPRPNESPEVVGEGYCCAYEVYFKGCEAGFSLSTSELLGLFLARESAAAGNQTIPRPTVDFLSFFRIVSEGETNWNSFTLQCIHKAGLAIKDGQTHPLDPPPEEKDVSSLNAQDKRKMQEAALSAAGDTHGAEILNDPPVATAICPSEPGCEGEITSSPCTKRNAPDSDNLSSERLKTVRLSSPPRVSSPLRSVSPSSEPLNSELPLPGDKVISEATGEPRPAAPLSQGLSVRTQNHLPASISGGEEIGDIFRSFQTREGASLPPFSVWRPEIRQMFANRARYLSQAFMETNGMIFNYENLLHQAKRETAKAKKEVDDLRLANQSERFEREKALESSFENMKKTLAANEQRIRIANAERDSARSNASRLEAELEENTALFEEANQEIELLTRNKARDIAEAEHTAREEMRGFGRQHIQSVTKFIKDEEVWTKLLTDRAELKSNLDLIKELEAGRVSFENERSEVAAELAMVESELFSASRPTLDLKQFSLVFGDSPSQFEVGEGSRPHEGSPEV
ncbi:uncharacterized protein LOC110227379 [Arabidopsis lyrata subsp. lyrata]|uniref:uncharacterized protein LOC110227379 n=1 Tax=Arabidopsis lyrata subsp. lyrata TaxID=81972 RepID=UPI000A29E528|nr:uncharacterized protein LOC110227379 [Arabidopsis lyrata subsp. lyrata]|eukprot:XP_020877126.1 uncharacterized protein LOC110227379 [Arabidopsis lyrata subsp. lyrata]